MKLTEVAASVGVTSATLSNWRNNEDYAAFRDSLAARADDLAIEKAVALRKTAADVIEKGLALAMERLSTVDDVGSEDVDMLMRTMKAALDVYKTTSAQTGVVERKSIDHSISAPEQALAMARETLRGAKLDD